ncbi:MAG: hypothetical protein K6G83_07885 [Lachnospiraceae bacterium]|nr:hypothetical protein [Lachnospiraceae bacterium]
MSDYEKEHSQFVSIYVERLTENIKQHANDQMKLLDINLYDSFELNEELAQEITGYPSAFSAISGDHDTLVHFAEDYARVGIDQYDDLCKEALLDFLNLINGLFAVYLSQNNIHEVSLNAPTRDEKGLVLDAEQIGKIYAIPIEFPYGIVTFVLAEPRELTKLTKK